MTPEETPTPEADDAAIEDTDADTAEDAVTASAPTEMDDVPLRRPESLVAVAAEVANADPAEEKPEADADTADRQPQSSPEAGEVKSTTQSAENSPSFRVSQMV